MNELLYTAQDLAIILIGMDLDCRIESAVMDRIWNREKEFLAEPYRQDRRKFTREVLYWRHSFSEKTTPGKIPTPLLASFIYTASPVISK